MNPSELKFKLTALLGWLALLFETYFPWLAFAVLLGLFVFEQITLAGFVLWTLTWIFLWMVVRQLRFINNELSGLNDKFAVNQRKLTKSIKEHNDFITEAVSSQKRFFDSIINPKKHDDN
jgi:hypothetical protein